MIDNSTAKKALNKLLCTGGIFGEIFVQRRISNSLRLDDGKIENASSGFETGCGLRLIHNDSTYYAFIDNINDKSIIEAAEILSKAVSNSNIKKAADLTKLISSFKSEVSKYPHNISAVLKKEILEKADSSARKKSPFVVQVSASLSDLEEEIYIANSEGITTSEKSVKIFLAVSVIARKDKEIRTGYKSCAKTKGYEIFNEVLPDEVADKSAQMAVSMLDAVNAPSGLMPVVIGPGFGGVIFHEACGHGLEADAIVKDASVFKDMKGKKIAAGIVNAIDDASIPYHWGSYKFDGEGTPSRKTVLIENGFLKSYLMDIKSSKKLSEDLTGNGRRQSYRDIPFPRMSNTFIDNGAQTPEEILKSVKKGIYAKEFAGGQVDPATGDFVFGISEGYLIENGSITKPIKGATLIGNGPDALKKIEAVGNDLEFAPGFCGKNGQSIANEVGQPTIKVSEMTVGGII